jgi:hypothetical protein
LFKDFAGENSGLFFMEKPQRVQRKRTKGFIMPPNTVYVGRPTKWGNPYKVGKLSEDASYPVTSEQAVAFYTHYITVNNLLPYIMTALKGKNLACWCPLDQVCHADVLLRIANQ